MMAMLKSSADIRLWLTHREAIVSYSQQHCEKQRSWLLARLRETDSLTAFLERVYTPAVFE